jgi:CRP/FNR family cyclic AMP-dependent transcriptional regulator
MPLSTLSPRNKIFEKLLPHCHRRRYSAKSAVICLGDQCENLFFVLSGSMSVLIDDSTGKELIITYLQPGEFFGELGLFAKEGTKQERSAWVFAKTECEIAEISYDKFRELAKHHPEILYTVIRQMAERIRHTTHRAVQLTTLDITGRVTSILLELCKQPGAMNHPAGIQIRVTRQEIARIISCSREMVGRVLKKLETQGMLQIKGKSIVVFSPSHEHNLAHKALEQFTAHSQTDLASKTIARRSANNLFRSNLETCRSLSNAS